MKKVFINSANLNKFLLILFILLSVSVKFFQISYRSFTLDELYAVVAALEPSDNVFLENWVYYDSNPPLYYFFLRFWLKIFPANEFWVRLPSTLFVLAATFIFVKGIKKRFENLEWFYLLLLLGTSYGFLFFAQEARAYGMLFFFTCIQLLYFIDLQSDSQNKLSLNKLSLFTLFTILSCYTHYTGILFSFFLFTTLFVVFYKKRNSLKLFLAIIVCFLAGLYWLQYFMVILKLDKSFLISQNYIIIKEIVSMLFFGYQGVDIFFTVLLVMILVYLALSLKIKLNETTTIYKSILFLGLFSITIILFSPFIPYFYYYRHYMILIPIILLGLSFLLTLSKPSNNFNSILLIVGIIIILNQGATHYKSTREEWRQAVKYIVDTNKSKKLKVIILGEPWQKSHKEYLMIDPGYLNLAVRRKSFYEYYFNRFDPLNTIELVVVRPNYKELESYINRELKSSNEIFILSNSDEFAKSLNKIKLNKKCNIQEKNFYVHNIYHIEEKN